MSGLEKKGWRRLKMLKRKENCNGLEVNGIITIWTPGQARGDELSGEMRAGAQPSMSARFFPALKTCSQFLAGRGKLK